MFVPHPGVHQLSGNTVCHCVCCSPPPQDVRTEMASTGWLCPHCYEEDNPEAGWICNSSICMKRRGLAPTGIAIYAAKERGFKSVGHLLQVGRQSYSIPVCSVCVLIGSQYHRCQIEPSFNLPLQPKIFCPFNLLLTY